MPGKRAIEPTSPAAIVARARTEAVRQALRRELKVQGLRQAEVSQVLGMGESYLANLFTTVRGKRPVALRLETLLGVLEVMGLPPSRFFAEVEAHERRNAAPAGTGLDPRLEELAQRADQLSPEEMAELGESMLRFVRRVMGRDRPQESPPGGARSRRRRA